MHNLNLIIREYQIKPKLSDIPQNSCSCSSKCQGHKKTNRDFMIGLRRLTKAKWDSTLNLGLEKCH